MQNPCRHAELASASDYGFSAACRHTFHLCVQNGVFRCDSCKSAIQNYNALLWKDIPKNREALAVVCSATIKRSNFLSLAASAKDTRTSLGLASVP